ncbi:histidine phosphatase family protein [Chthonomonas calidirosea]|uniref:histidine phosphatase family protein n=1 Tax=Chthonomonas calidirosea TaxID=454171 RepID=UPI0006ECAEED|nr:histidine phosphatase family protein [Chthonomonas calidirosea]CEK15734.1 fructose-2,6-bisphosphatase [Chthonomonas calidirosea]
MPEGRLRLYIVRHGRTIWNEEGRMQGHTDVPLDAEGHRQAERIADRLSALPQPLQAVWSSDLQRARVTAEVIARRFSLPVQATPLLRETMLGDWEGLTRAEIVARGDKALLEAYDRDSFHNRPPNSEPLAHVWQRMLQVLHTIRSAFPTGQVAIVGHGSSLRVLFCNALRAPMESMPRVWVDNASLSLIEEEPREPEPFARLLLLNDTSHLVK